MDLVKENFLLDEIESEGWIKFEEAARQITLAVHTTPTGPESLAAMQNTASTLLNRAGKALIPWGKWAVTPEDKAAALKDKAEESKQRYEHAFGELTSAKVKEAENKAKMFLLGETFIGRARKENRKFTTAQQKWLAAARASLLGDAAAWAQISTIQPGEICRLFAETFDIKDVRKDIKSRLGVIL